MFRVKKRFLKSISIVGGICFFAFACRTGTDQKDEIIDKENEYLVSKPSLKQETQAVIQILNNETFNFGNIKAGDTVVHKFFLKNTGKMPLTIESIMADCGCTIADFNKSPIRIGDTDSIVMTFASDTSMIGFQNKVATVNYNSSSSPLLLTIYGKVK